MSIGLFQRIVLTCDLAGEKLRAGDVGVVVEHYAPRARVPEGYDVEFFTAAGHTLAVVSVPADGVRPVTNHEVLSVRTLART